MAADEHRVFEAIGELKTEIKNLRGDFTKLQASSTAEHRTVHDIVVAMSESVRNISRIVDEMKPLTDDYREKRAEARGAAKFATALWMLVGGGVMGAIVWLKDLLMAKPHPVVIALLLVLSSQALAHDSWISRGALKNGAGEWCCGEGDCALMDKGAVQARAYGYVIYGHGTIGEGDGAIRTELIDEIVPFSEAQPSPDGQFWRCKRPDGTRRCFFAPPPNS